ncbi:hypothetical protein MSAN_02124100 [Mycena sanguinolenta]|uniref:Uncharacterized protein n=1 Tax=Mycena sanguinolenta TaxID=230812 RepID=A0A8H7CLJ2_9AGAR|nr:hypothetical protein MSAN_02124100 [Mycena sanguinolenta]
MHLAVLASTVFAAVGLVKATDYYQLWTIPAGSNMAQFDTAFHNACINWAPGEAAGLTPWQIRVLPGDFQGNNPDTEALIYCLWTDVDDEVVDFTVAVATSLGASPN